MKKSPSSSIVLYYKSREQIGLDKFKELNGHPFPFSPGIKCLKVEILLGVGILWRAIRKGRTKI